MTLRELRDRINATPEALLDLPVRVLDRNMGVWLDLADYTTAPGDWIGAPLDDPDYDMRVQEVHPVLVPGP